MKVLEIVKYENRKIYVRNLNRYTNLDEIQKFVQNGFKVKIKADKTGENITKSSLLRIIYNEEKKHLTHVSEKDLIEIIEHRKGLCSYINSLKRDKK